MIRLVLLLSTLISVKAFAADHTPGIFIGAGLNLGSQTYSPEGGATSRFASQGYEVLGGYGIAFTDNFGFEASAELGRNVSQNNGNSAGFMELGTLDYYGAKAGFYIHHFQFGGGYRHNSVDTKSLASPAPGYLESTYTGFTPLGYAGFNFDFKSRYRSVIEVQYVTGTLESSAPSSVATKYQDVTVGLKFLILFD